MANCQAGMFLAYVSPLGRALVDKRLYLPESWTSDKDRCEAAGVPEDRQGYRSKTELALEMVGRAQERARLKAGWVAADDAFGMSPSFRDGPGGPWGCGTCWTFRPALRCGRRSLPGPVWSIRDSGVPASRGSAAGSSGQCRSAATSCRRRPGMSSRWPREARDHAATCSVPRGCVQPAGVSPAKSTGPFTAGIWTAANPATICPMHRRDTPLETLAYVGGSRWRIETEFETEKSDVGLGEYETRTWSGWHHHVALCLLGGAFLLSLQQAWGEKDAPDHEAAGLPGGAGDAAPGNGSGRLSCCGGWRIRRTVTNGPRRSHAKRRAAMRASPHIPP